MIRSFACRQTEAIFHRERPKRFPPEILRVALRKLVMLDSASRLEALKGSREGQHSIRVNDQWRICFTWRDGHAYKVKVVDYH